MSEGTAATANDHQVGGSHYRTPSKVQHWDLIIEYGVDYLRACASKYVARARRKNGEEDLQKGVHYLQKYAEDADNASSQLFRALIPVRVVMDWAQDMDLSLRETRILLAILSWRTIDEAISLTNEMIEKQYRTAARDPLSFPFLRGGTIPPAGTPEDGGHHGMTEADLSELESTRRT